MHETPIAAREKRLCQHDVHSWAVRKFIPAGNRRFLSHKANRRIERFSENIKPVCFAHLFPASSLELCGAAATASDDPLGGLRQVLYWEEPIWDSAACEPALRLSDAGGNVTVATPVLPNGMTGARQTACLRTLLDDAVAARQGPLIRWYYTSMMLGFSAQLAATCTIYHCMDELASFRFAPPELPALEAELMAASDLVFTGGYSLFEAKRGLHRNIHPLPSSVDLRHFARARADPRHARGATRAARFPAAARLDPLWPPHHQP
jgi:hypothetical protein